MSLTPTAYLLMAIGTLVLGPVLFFLLRERSGPFRFLDGFVMVAVPGLIFFHVVPEAVAHRDPWLALAVGAGFAAPGLLERLTRDAAGRTDLVALVLAISGLALHALLEGAALTPLSGPADLGLGLAVALHRIPVGLALWWLIRERTGDGAAVAAVAGIAVLTGVGFAGGGTLETLVGSGAVELYQAFVGGTLVHVAFHQIGEHHASRPGRRDSVFEGSGALVALLLLALVGVLEAGAGEGEGLALVVRMANLAAVGAPALLLAYLGAGVLAAVTGPASIRGLSRGGPLGAAARGTLLGLRSPLGSWSVEDLYRTPLTRGAAPAAALAFLVATRALGLDALLVSVPLLGTGVAFARVALAAGVALLVGGWVGRRIEARTALPVMDLEPSARPVWVHRIRSGMRSGMGAAVDHSAPWFLLGVLVAALAAPLLSGGVGGSLPGWMAVLGMALLGIPWHVRATAATAPAAVLLAAGLPAGAVLAFLVTGPVLDMRGLRELAGFHGRGVAVRFGTWVTALALLSGLAANRWLADVRVPSLDRLVAGPATGLEWAALGLLALLLVGSLLRRGVRRFVEEVGMARGHRHHTHHGAHGHADVPGEPGVDPHFG